MGKDEIIEEINKLAIKDVEEIIRYCQNLIN